MKLTPVASTVEAELGSDVTDLVTRPDLSVAEAGET